MKTAQAIRERILARLPQADVALHDESASHLGHPEAGDAHESHFRLTVSTHDFEGLTMIARHRLIHEAIGNLEDLGIHALQIDAKLPGNSAATGGSL